MGLTMKRLRAHPKGIDLGPLRPGLLQRLTRRHRHIALLPAPIAKELSRLTTDWTTPAHATPPIDGQLTLIGRRDVRSNNSWMHNSERLVSGKTRCVLWMHPQDASTRGLMEGQSVTVRSRVGQVQVPIKVTDDIRPGVVSLPHGWGHGRAGVRLQVAQRHAGISMNDLTDDQLTDRISANAALNSVPVQVSAS